MFTDDKEEAKDKDDSHIVVEHQEADLTYFIVVQVKVMNAAQDKEESGE